MVLRKPVASRSAKPAAKASTRTTRSAAPARKAAPAKTSQKASPKVAEEVSEIHPVHKNAPSAHDVLRALETYNRLYQQYWENHGELVDFVAPTVPEKTGAKATSPLRKAAVHPDDAVIGERLDRDKVSLMSLVELRETAVELGLEETKIKSKILLEMERRGIFRGSAAADSDEDDADLDEGDEEDEEEFDDAELDRSDLEDMDLKELQQLAKDNQVKGWRGLDKDGLIDLLMPEDEDEDEDDEEDDEEEDEDDGDDFTIDPDTLNDMSVAELTNLCKEIGLDIPAKISKSKRAIVEFILENAEEE